MRCTRHLSCSRQWRRRHCRCAARISSVTRLLGGRLPLILGAYRRGCGRALQRARRTDRRTRRQMQRRRRRRCLPAAWWRLGCQGNRRAQEVSERPVPKGPAWPTPTVPTERRLGRRSWDVESGPSGPRVQMRRRHKAPTGQCRPRGPARVAGPRRPVTGRLRWSAPGRPRWAGPSPLVLGTRASSGSCGARSVGGVPPRRLDPPLPNLFCRPRAGVAGPGPAEEVRVGAVSSRGYTPTPSLLAWCRPQAAPQTIGRPWRAGLV